jgi:hypothetical protein
MPGPAFTKERFAAPVETRGGSGLHERHFPEPGSPRPKPLFHRRPKPPFSYPTAQTRYDIPWRSKDINELGDTFGPLGGTEFCGFWDLLHHPRCRPLPQPASVQMLLAPRQTLRDQNPEPQLILQARANRS